VVLWQGLEALLQLLEFFRLRVATCIYVAFLAAVNYGLKVIFAIVFDSVVL
jgi:hypothetical protein